MEFPLFHDLRTQFIPSAFHLQAFHAAVFTLRVIDDVRERGKRSLSIMTVGAPYKLAAKKCQ
ncbi:hypothetical protein ASG39_08795 [Rhizobium sp. Leaf371]|nr:hypothetical protein ASG39_08795 [Rhizobium sp. Leaf371]